MDRKKKNKRQKTEKQRKKKRTERPSREGSKTFPKPEYWAGPFKTQEVRVVRLTRVVSVK